MCGALGLRPRLPALRDARAARVQLVDLPEDLRPLWGRHVRRLCYVVGCDRLWLCRPRQRLHARCRASCVSAGSAVGRDIHPGVECNAGQPRAALGHPLVHRGQHLQHCRRLHALGQLPRGSRLLLLRRHLRVRRLGHAPARRRGPPPALGLRRRNDQPAAHQVARRQGPDQARGRRRQARWRGSGTLRGAENAVCLARCPGVPCVCGGDGGVRDAEPEGRRRKHCGRCRVAGRCWRAWQPYGQHHLIPQVGTIQSCGRL